MKVCLVQLENQEHKDKLYVYLRNVVLLFVFNYFVCVCRVYQECPV